MYLPPENSIRGRDSEELFSFLSGEVYRNSEKDIIILGDFNAKVGNLQDVSIDTHANIGHRTAYNKDINSHSRNLIEFLENSGICMLNGRKCPNSATSISTKGKSHIDYCLSNYDCYDKIRNVNILDTLDLISKFKLECNINSTSKPPDHNILEFDYVFDRHVDKWHEINDLFTGTGETTKKLKLNRKPMENYLYEYKKEIELTIDNIVANSENQCKLNTMYEKFTELLLDASESKLVDYKYRRKVTAFRPYWTKDLETKWKSVHLAHENYKKNLYKNHKSLLTVYKWERSEFDKMLRVAKRKHSRRLYDKINQYNITNPNLFWNLVNQLGPKPHKDIELCVEQNGKILYSTELALQNWYSEYKKLFYKESAGKLEEEVYFEQNDIDNELNSVFTFSEISDSINSLKPDKGVGCDNVCNKLLKNNIIKECLVPLFNSIFRSTTIPDQWRKILITPIPKGKKSVPTKPLSYRGLSLQCCIFKVYSKILNNRFMCKMELEEQFSECQNGFRKKHSTNEHIFSLYNLICLNSKIRKNSTYLCFVDLSKAFDCVDRRLLYDRLKELNVNGSFMNNYIKGHVNNYYQLNVNNKKTEPIPSNVGVKQGAHESPAFFLSFIDPLLRLLEKSNAGVKLKNGQLVNVLAYADDIVLIAKTPEELQMMLNTLNKWCMSNRISVNVEKTNTMQIRSKNYSNFLFNNETVLNVQQYKYLGIWFDEKLNFDQNSKMVSGAGNRAWCYLINKIQTYRDFNIRSFSRLYEAMILPILNYGCEIWNLKDYKCISDISNRAIRYFLGVHKFAPSLSLYGETGSCPISIHVNLSILRMYNRICKMSDDRLPKQIFLSMDSHFTWYNRLSLLKREFFPDNSNLQTFSPMNLTLAKARMIYRFDTKWKENICNKVKLRTYMKFKENTGPDCYLFQHLPKNQRSIIAQLRIGILPLRVETGRFLNEPLNTRICKFCNKNEIEDESHFINSCELYENERNSLKSIMLSDFDLLNDLSNLNYLFSKYPKTMTDYVFSCWNTRKRENLL